MTVKTADNARIHSLSSDLGEFAGMRTRTPIFAVIDNERLEECDTDIDKSGEFVNIL
jgi:hypothetical protein